MPPFFMMNQRIYILFVILLSLVLSAAYLSIEGVPTPIVHDEFSYLLAADTYASGRLANPSHPMAEFFESFHVLSHPVYASKYMPGQGFVLALGQVLTGEPFYGVVWSVALLCGAICWLLQGYFKPEMGLLGGLIAAVQFSFYHYWGQSYWGGAVPALGAVLVFGSLPRIMSYKLNASILCGVGLGCLMLTRPFEGAVFSVVPAGVLVHWWWNQGLRSRDVWLKMVLPIAVCVCLTLLFILFYNYRVCGDAFTFPWNLYAEQRSGRGFSLFHDGEKHERKFLFDRMRLMYEQWYIPRANLHDTLIHRLINRLYFSSVSFLGSILTGVALLGVLLKATKERIWVRLILLISGWMLIVVGPYHPHYAAPLVVVTYYCLIDLINSLRGGGILSGKAIGYFFGGVLLLTIFLRLEAGRVYYQREDPLSLRPSFEALLSADGGKALVFVTYKNYNVHSEWVYNKADIDGSSVVWARSLGVEKNQELIDYYPERDVWMMLAVNNKVQIIPYTDYLVLEQQREGGGGS